MKRKREPVMYYIIGILSMIAAVVLIGCTARYIKEEQRETRQEYVEALKKYEKDRYSNINRNDSLLSRSREL